MTASSLPWWATTTVYQVYPRSFADGNGDGIGDLRGLIGRLDYLHDLGVETLWISPIYDSPQADFGYDIRDHFAVAAEYGTLTEVTALIAAVHARGMRLVFDMVLNHTSDQHAWFLDSRSSRASPKRDWYLWREGRRPNGGAPPNNWKAVIGGSGWHYDRPTGQWYWASFLPFQPDLNYRNPEVKRAMLDVVRFWLELGLDGLRLDLFNAIYKDASFANNPRSLRPFPTEENPHGFFQRNQHTIDHPDTFAFARELRSVVAALPPPERFLVGEVFGSTRTLRQYCQDDLEGPGLHLVFLFQAMRARLSAPALRHLLSEVEQAFPAPLQPTWVFGNHDRPRSLLRVGGDLRKAKLLALLQLTARGVPFIYYGEELGMAHTDVPLANALDPIASRFRFVPDWVARRLRNHGMLLNRDECRMPMLWTEELHGGFSAIAPWLEREQPSPTASVVAQSADATSMYWVYRTLLWLRRMSASLRGGALTLEPPSPHVLAFRRGDGATAAHVRLNLSSRPQPLVLPDETPTRYSTLRGWVGLSSGPLQPFEGLVALAGQETSASTILSKIQSDAP